MRKHADSVNYLLEIKSFYTWLEMHPLKAGAIALWHALMNYWNFTYWTKDFSPAMQILTIRSGLSKSSVLRAREELISAGRLRIFESGKRALTRYEIILFHPFDADFDTLYKQNKTKQDETKQNKTNCAYPALRVFRNEDGFLVPEKKPRGPGES